MEPFRRRWFRVGLGLILALCVAAEGYSQSRAAMERTLAEAVALVTGDDNDPAGALRLLNQILSRQPNHCLALFWRARVYTTLGRYEEAGGDAETLLGHLDSDKNRDIIRKDGIPEIAETLNRRGIVRFRGGDPAKALPDFDRALALVPSERTFLWNSGKMLALLGRNREAVNQLGRLLERGMDDPEILVEALWYRSQCYLKLGDRSAARGEAERMVEFDARLKTRYGGDALMDVLDEAQFKTRMGTAAEAARKAESDGDFPRAFRHWEEMRQWPPNFRMYPALAQESAEAMARLYSKLALTPEVPEGARRFAVQADVSAKERRYADAVSLYKRALAVAPWWPLGNYNVALHEEQLGLYGDAIAHMKLFVSASPAAPTARAAQDKIYEWELRARSGK